MLDDLTPSKLAEMAAEERANGARKWKSTSCGLLDEAVSDMKHEFDEELSHQLEMKAIEVETNLCREFHELMRQYGREIEAYVTSAGPSRREIFSSLARRSPSHPPMVKRKEVETEELAFDTDFSRIVEELQEAGHDIGDIMKLADGCILCGGVVLTPGDSVAVETRASGKPMNAVISAVTTGELVIKFKDGSTATIDASDLTSRRVVIRAQV